ncbi:hypothetical protein ACODT5_22080 [Streptomyces sp. 5.8]
MSLPARYLGYIGYFVGAGLISGAVVHHPLDPARYTRIAGYGVVVFLAATVLNEFVLTRSRPGLPRVLTVIGASLMLSFGIGMLSGGLQHFQDFPARAAALIPLGLLVSFIAYVIKDADTSWRRIFSLVGLAVLVTAVGASLGLRQVAASMTTEGRGHGHGTSKESTPQVDEPAATPSASHSPAPAASPKASEGPKKSAGHSAGHGH